MINKLVANIKKTNAPIVVGLDRCSTIFRSMYRRKHSQSSGRLRGSSRGNLAVQ